MISANPSRISLKYLLSKFSGIIAPLSFLLLLDLVLWRVAPHFATRDNLKQIAIQAAVVAILACGQTIVIITANIDLSVGAIMAFCGIVISLAAIHHPLPIPLLILLSCLAGAGCGLLNGLVTAWGGIPSFIVTLGALSIVHGAAGVLSHSVDIQAPARLSVFGYGELFGSATRDGIPYAVLVLAVAAIVVHIFLSRTVVGRSLYAMGSNPEATRLSGIKVKNLTVLIFMLSGLMAGVAAIVSVARAGVASKDAGIGYELDSIAATVLGGTSLFGGQGGIPGALIGALLIFTIRNGCELKGYGPELQEMIIGTVIILAVLYDRFGPGRRNYKTI